MAIKNILLTTPGVLTSLHLSEQKEAILYVNFCNQSEAEAKVILYFLSSGNEPIEDTNPNASVIMTPTLAPGETVTWSGTEKAIFEENDEIYVRLVTGTNVSCGMSNMGM